MCDGAAGRETGAWSWYRCWPNGKRLLKEMVRSRVGELRSNGLRLVLAIHQILATPRQPQDLNQARN
jgi:hypothetical protein